MSNFCIRFYLENSVVRYISGPKLLDKWVFRITDHDTRPYAGASPTPAATAISVQQRRSVTDVEEEEYIDWRSDSRSKGHSAFGMANLLGISNLMTTVVDRRKRHTSAPGTDGSLSHRELRFTSAQNDKIVRNINIRNGLHTYLIKFTLTRQRLNEDSAQSILPLTAPSWAHSADMIGLQSPVYDSRIFNAKTSDNEVEILIDGLQTFSRYYHYMMQAKESIDILSWEMSLQFGLVFIPKSADMIPMPTTGLLHSWKKYSQELFNWERLFGSSGSSSSSSTSSSTSDGKSSGNGSGGRWITLQEVLLAKAASGVKIRIMVWRHHILSYLNRFLYLGDFTIEREVEKLQKTAKEMGLTVKVYHTDFNLPDRESTFANYPFYHSHRDEQHQHQNQHDEADIVFVIVGNPKGLVSSHHEKVVLIDAEIPDRAVAFIGGFDIARGRFDQPLHQPPLPLWDFSHLFEKEEHEGDESGGSKRSRVSERRHRRKNKPRRYGDSTIQPWLRFIRYLWHDEQVFLRGGSTRVIHLHFIQRWMHAFTGDNYIVRQLQLPDFSHRNESLDPNAQRMVDANGNRIHRKVKLTTLRAWPGVLDEHTLLDNVCTLIRNAQDYVYVEHQYPFQNYSLAQCMLQALNTNQNLKLIVITCIKTDLPTGFVGSMLDISQTHINDNINMLYRAAPDRVGIYGIVRQDKSDTIKSVYIHSKLIIIDDKVMCVGSANLDNLSFYKSSEFNVNIHNEAICRETKMRLVCEHLELVFEPLSSYEELLQQQQRTTLHGPSLLEELQNDFGAILREFNRAAQINYTSLINTGKLSCRVFALSPQDRYDLIYRLVNYPGFAAKLLYKLGWDNPQFLVKHVVNNLEQSAHLDIDRNRDQSAIDDRSHSSRQFASFFIQSRL